MLLVIFDSLLIIREQADCDKTTKMVKRLMDAIEIWDKDNAGAYGCRLSFSIGCSACKKERDVHTAIKEADERMHQNKKAKRNDVQV
jgi:diguanylate cyclase (GGDEF)-like protein